MKIHQQMDVITNPTKTHHWFSRIFYLYLWKIFWSDCKYGYKRRIFRLPEEREAQQLGKQIQQEWKSQSQGGKRASVLNVLWRLFGKEFSIIGFIQLFVALMKITIMPLCIGNMVNFFENFEEPKENQLSKIEALLSAVAFLVALLLDCLLSNYSGMKLHEMSMKLNMACGSLMYWKTFRLDVRNSNPPLGQILNLFSNILNKFQESTYLTHYCWISVVQTSIGIYFLYKILGVAAYYGILFLLASIPIQIFMANKLCEKQIQHAEKCDERVSAMTEVINGIKLIKMYGWEDTFMNIIRKARNLEMEVIKKYAYVSGILYSFDMFISKTSLFITFSSYILMGESLTTQIIFKTSSTYQILRSLITMLFSYSLWALGDLNVAVTKIQQYMDLPEMEEKMEQIQSNQKPIIIMEKVKVDSKENDTLLENIDFRIANPKTVAVIGPVGSGKTTLFHVILKELPVTEGRFQIDGTISYCSQESWMFLGSIKENIIFGNKYDQNRYSQVLKVCCLEKDLDNFEKGDETLVGERGQGLSGGQKARINLARAIYREADIYILDDPLSSVDTSVGRDIFQNCIKTFLSGKICLVSTHQIQYLKEFDEILIFDKGKLIANEIFENLKNREVDFTALLNRVEQNHDLKNKQDDKHEGKTFPTENEDLEVDMKDGGKHKLPKMNPKSTLKSFLLGGGNIYEILFLLLMLISYQYFQNFMDYFISTLSDKNKYKSDENFANDQTLFAKYTLATIFFSMFHVVLFSMFMYKCSKALHEEALGYISKAAMTFFDTNPTGKIISRFTKELADIDGALPSVFLDICEITLQFSGIFILTTLANKFLMFPLALIAIIFAIFKVICGQTSKNVKILVSNSNSPMLNQISGTIQGLVTIRNCGGKEISIKKLEECQNHLGACNLMNLICVTSIGLWLDLICIFSTTLILVYVFVFDKEFTGHQIGLIFTQYMGTLGVLHWFAQQLNVAENELINIYRLQKYSEIEKEPERLQTLPLSKSWPTSGRIEFKNVCLTYNQNEQPILKNLSFIINSGEKIGIVGRTGSGKSSLVSALLQLYEFEGEIFIDDKNIKEINVQEYRTKLSVLPQEPTIFSGTIRSNLDPLKLYHDEALWKVLDSVGLLHEIEALPNSLDGTVKEGGPNFSFGQKQLLCLARTILRKSRILILDEATANVDYETDSRIQENIQNNFGDCTVISIAHRLDSLANFDRIMVLDQGKIVDFDKPNSILRINNFKRQ